MNRIMKPCICLFGLFLIIVMSIPSTPLSHPYNGKTIDNLDQNLIKTAMDPIAFVSIWNTNALGWGSSASNQVHLPLVAEGTYNFTVSWGDGINTTIQNWSQPEVTYTYSTGGEYTLLINGTIIGWNFDERGDCLKISEIQQWGCLQLGNAGGYFAGCANLHLTASDKLNLTDTTDLSRMFSGCTNLGSSGNLNEWDVSQVTDMWGMFYCASAFNQPLENWSVSSVTDMGWMFYAAYNFNQPIGTWDVSSVTIMQGIFQNATSFNQPIGNWNVSQVTDMSGMFYAADTFNQPIGMWDVSQVTDMSSMFGIAVAFNQAIGTWDVSQVTSMNSMFQNANSFNRFIGGWNVSKVTSMSGMFYAAYSFNQPIGTWDVSQVTEMSSMFGEASTFNQPIGIWDVSQVTSMNSMFYKASTFNQPIGTWDVSQVTDMNSMFLGITLSSVNYDHLLLGWAQLSLQSGVNFHGGNSQYTIGIATEARQHIIDTFGWSIIDGGQVPIVKSVSTPPLNLQAISGNGFIALSWDPPLDIGYCPISAYYIYRTTSETGDYLYLASSPTNSYTDTTVSNGVTYYYKVKALNEIGLSEFSNSASSSTPKSIRGFEYVFLTVFGIGIVLYLLGKSTKKTNIYRDKRTFH